MDFRGVGTNSTDTSRVFCHVRDRLRHGPSQEQNKRSAQEMTSRVVNAMSGLNIRNADCVKNVLFILDVFEIDGIAVNGRQPYLR